jgi:hypothetical protein
MTNIRLLMLLILNSTFLVGIPLGKIEFFKKNSIRIRVVIRVWSKPRSYINDVAFSEYTKFKKSLNKKTKKPCHIPTLSKIVQRDGLFY